ncbi:PBSX family phage terminase large subunit [bacterium]|nr:PBSX family phage terminase large subunit [bacterium]NDD84530.1 PBSX family phage terminase large subunit [bacterium]NDG30696.1 PBSX family phage terminase large subunit [bacterium]
MEPYTIDLDQIESWSYVDFEPVYDFEVENNHNYCLVTESNETILVHNSGKSQTMIQFFLSELLNHDENDNETFVVLRKVAATIRTSVYMDFKNKIYEWGLGDLITAYDGIFEFRSRSNKIIFMGVDNPEKLKSLAQAKYIWVEEATELSKEDFIQVTLRLRGISKHQKRFFLTFNPVSDSHWIKERFFDRPPDVEKNKILILHSTYKDCYRFLDKEYPIRMEALKDIDYTYWDVYANGNWGVWDRETLYVQYFDPNNHVVDGYLKAHQDYPLYLSFDFNITNTCVAIQFSKNAPGHSYYGTINVIKTYRHGDLGDLCNMIKQEFPGMRYVINGDPAGQARSAFTTANMSAYQLIANFMNLPDMNLQIMRSSPSHLNTRIVDTLVFRKCKIQIAEEANKALIADFKEAKVDRRISLDTWKQKNPDKSHALDAWRYFSFANFYEIASEYNIQKFNGKLLQE